MCIYFGMSTCFCVQVFRSIYIYFGSTSYLTDSSLCLSVTSAGATFSSSFYKICRICTTGSFKSTSASTDSSVCSLERAVYFTYSYNVLTFAESISRLILYSVNYISGTIVASTPSPTSPIDIYSSFTTSATTSVYVWHSVIPDASIASSSFKLASNSLIITLLLNNLSRSIGFINECPTQWFLGV